MPAFLRGGVAMSAPNLRELALLEGTPASVVESEGRFGIKVGAVASLLVVLGYHDAKKAIQSDDALRQAKGRKQMLALAGACEGLAGYYEVLGLTLEAAQAAEIEGTAAAFAGEEFREERLAVNWCLRLTGERDFSDIVRKASDLEGDWWVIGLKFLLKLAKYTDLSFPQRWALVTLMASKIHPDTLGRALWAIEIAPDDTAAAYSALSNLVGQEALISAGKPDQVSRFQERFAALGAQLAAHHEEVSSD